MTVSMFRQDVTLAVVPIGIRRGDKAKFKIDIGGTDKEQKRVVALLLSLSSRDEDDFSELVADVIEEIVQDLAWFGRATYEIGRPRQNSSIFLLNAFTAQRLFNFYLWFVQVIPKKDRERWNRSFTVLSQQDVWLVSMPRHLGGRRGYRGILRQLQRFGHSGPEFWRNDLAQGRRLPSYFDFTKYRREVDIFESRATREWGWNRRDFSGRNWTEFAQLYRTLTFRWAQAILREHVISELNGLLVRLGIKAEILVSGIATSREILEIRREMSEGKTSFGKALDAVSI